MYQKGKPSNFLRAVILTGALLALLAAGLALYRQASGESLGLRGMAEQAVWAVTNPFKNLISGRAIVDASQGRFTNIIFLHHSTGNNLLLQSDMKETLRELGYQLWDHGRNAQGLRDPYRKAMRYTYNVPGDNTDPDGLAVLFSQPALPLPLNAFSRLLQHEVIIVKSCFEPANNIRSDEQLEQYKAWYRGMRDVMAAHPDRLFILLTTPPLNPAATNPEEAARARRYAEWLLSDEFLQGAPNIFVFDFFDHLAEPDPAAPDYNMLRADYRDADDSHPNKTANVAVGPVFTGFVVESIETYRGLLSKAGE